MASGSQLVMVAGGGLAGLTAAHRLRQAGVRVRILEAADEPGGRVKTVRKDGYILDVGADALTSKYTRCLALAAEVGLQPSLVPITGVVGVIRNGRLICFDTARMMSLMLTPLYSWRAKLALVRGAKKLQSQLASVDPIHLYRLGESDSADQNAQTLGMEVFGRELTDYFVDPMALMLNGRPASETSAVDVLAGLAISAGATSLCFRGGQSSLCEALAAQLPIEYGSRVTAVEEGASQARVSWTDAAGVNHTQEVHGCVIATMYAAAAGIFPGFAHAAAELARFAEPNPLIRVHLGYGIRTRSQAYMIQTPSIEDGDCRVMFLDHNKCSDRAPAGFSLINVVLNGDASRRWLDEQDADIVHRVRDKIEALVPELSGNIQMSHVTRWRNAGQVARPGFYRAAQRAVAQLSAPSRVQIASDMFTKSSQEAAVVSGEAAARALLSG